MSDYERDDLQRAHNKGQEDEDYDPPYDTVDHLMTWRPSQVKKVRERNEAYDKGWNNDKKQS